MTRQIPNGEQIFLTDNGLPVALGTVGMFIPATMTPKNTWQDKDKVTLNANPIVLDAAGRAIIWGEGDYRQILADSLGNEIWDRVVSSGENSTGVAWGGTGSGTGNAQIVTVAGFTVADGATFEYIVGFSNTGPATIAVNGNSPLAVLTMTPSGPAPVDGGDLIAKNIARLVYVSTLGGYVIVNGTGGQFNALPESTELNPIDFGAYYDIDNSRNEKILISNWLKVVAQLTADTDPAAGDLISVYKLADTVVYKMTLASVLRVIKDLPTIADPDVTADFVAVYSNADVKATRMSLQNVGGVWRFIAPSKTADSGDSSIIFKDLGSYRMLRITFANVVPLTDDSRLQLQISINNGTSWITTNYVNVDTGKTDALWIASATATNRVANNAQGGLNGVLTLANVGSALYKVLSGSTSWRQPGDKINTYTAGGYSAEGNPASALKFAWEAGNFLRGTIYLEGIKS